MLPVEPVQLRRRAAATAPHGAPALLRGRLGVVHDGVGDDDDPVAGQGGAPAEVDVVAQQRQRGSSPPSSSQTSRRTSSPAVLTASTCRVPSCWPWSCSRRSRPVSRRPLRAMVTPTSSSRRRSYQPQHLGAGDADRRVAGDLGEQVLQRVAVGRAVVVQQPDPVAVARVAATAGRRVRQAEQHGRAETRAGARSTRQLGPRASASSARESSVLPVSTATTVSGGRVWAASAARVRGSQAARHGRRGRW